MRQCCRLTVMKRFTAGLVCVVIAVAVGYADEHSRRQATLAPSSGMVRLAGGTFTMGTDAAKVEALMTRFSTKRRELFAAELPAHEVTLQPFSIDRTEVT